MARFGRRMMLMTATLASLLLLVAACGGGDDGTTAEATTAASGGGGAATTVNVALGTAENEYALTPDPSEASAGSITFAASNGGTLEHELIVIETDKGAANLGTDGGEADETGVVDELELEPGASGELTLDLAAGTYALICNIDDHYANGMYADFTVK